VLQRFEDQVAYFPRDRMIFGELKVVLHPGRLVSGSDATVYPVGSGQQATRVPDLLGVEDLRDVEQHFYVKSLPKTILSLNTITIPYRR
jgi:hypothetical protein